MTGIQVSRLPLHTVSGTAFSNKCVQNLKIINKDIG